MLSFLDHVQKDAQKLFIVGDLFDAWFEYRTVIPKGYHRLLTKLEDIVRSGIEIHYLTGNHDFWMRDYFSKEIGMNVHRDPFEAEIDGKRIFLHHGDGLATNDTGYRILKRILRHPINVFLYTWIHPDIGITLARSSSKTSRRHTSAKDYGEADGMLNLAREKIEQGFDIVIMGHRHKPASQEIGRGVYLNLGDWISYNTFAEFSGGSIALRTWRS